MLQTMCSPILTYSPWHIGPLDVLAHLRSEVLKTLWPRLPNHRSAVLLPTFLTPAHVVDPCMSLMYNLVTQVSRVLAVHERNDLPCRYVRVGLVTLLLDSLSKIGVETSEGFRVRGLDGREHSLLPPRTADKVPEWKHMEGSFESGSASGCQTGQRLSC